MLPHFQILKGSLTGTGSSQSIFIIGLLIAIIPLNRFSYGRRLLQVSLITYIALSGLSLLGTILQFLVNIAAAG